MIILPAIDLRSGRVVRLRQGRAEAETVYGDDPAEIAARWQSEGAEWLHVVNLDGAFGEDVALNLRALESVLKQVSIPVQFGGGLRDLVSIGAAFMRGVARVVIGTGAVQNPELVSDALAKFGAESVAVGIDARDGVVATHGWRALSAIPALDLANQMAERGITRIVYTDISRDGMLRGLDANAVAALAQSSGLKVIASGGVATLDDVRILKAREGDGIEGVIIGQALYGGALSLKDAKGVASSQSSVARPASDD
ncbi:MAG: 1-(5-phosphoribosyl)-5-[(5-phosphoribosylamino)methylideneamino]imidazole-4-carboxamide isomerase [Chloroflexi bacterium]|nr:1-(5-phosphoribosyl)-5-[(5-phosphoribosylamino)methylideneamino]imidazole-4-carboxamide isomerase [Chloroflexota bacterium]